MRIPGNTRQGDAFSRVELCAVIAAFFLLALLALPALAQPFSRSQRLQCLNNLRQIGQAYQVWANDHGDEFPFFVPASEGGLRGVQEASQAYYQFAVLSNELSSARVLACPSDSVLLADNFGDGHRGLLSVSHRDNSVSYFVMHGRVANGPELLSGDRNVSVTRDPAPCAFFSNPKETNPQQIAWQQGIHERTGNALMTSGDVLESGTAGLRAAVTAANFINALHMVVPR